ncbi:MAG TPA: hypothetical protein VLR94_01100 [Acidobacteriota bacterium]|nr:hypothetical protein [Acidobacteriota bacterium]
MYPRLFAIPTRSFPGRTLLLALACFVLFVCSSALLEACENGTDCNDLIPIQTPYLAVHGVSACNSDGSCDDPRATCQSGQCNIALMGYLYLPSLTPPHGGFPAIIYNHGSANDDPHHTASRACAVVKYFLARNYVVLTPVRRGYSPSTGTYFKDLPDIHAALRDERNDVKAAFDYLSGAAGFVNTNKIAIMGHSLGGVVTIFANEMDFGQRVAIPIAAGSESWDPDPELKDELIASVPNAKHYTYFFEPLNDVSTDPTIELSHIAGNNGQQYQATIFPPVPYATTGEEAHVCFVNDTKQVKKWGRTVLVFLKQYGIK